MAEDQDIQTPEAPPDNGGPGQGPSLTDAQKKELHGVVTKMILSKEPESNIKMVIDHYTSKYGTVAGAAPARATPAAPQFAGSPDFSNPVSYLAPHEHEEYNAAIQGANARMQDEAQKVDPAIQSILMDTEHQRRANVLQSQVQEKGDIANANPRLQRELQSILPKPLPVEISQDAVSSMKQQAANDPAVFGEILRRHAELNPDKATQIKADMYLLNSQSRAAGKESKILGNAEKMKKGEYDYNLWHPGGVEKPEGFFPSIVTAHRERNQEVNDYEYFQTHNDADIMKKLDEDRKAYDPDEPVHTPGGLGGAIGSGLGGNAELLAKGGGIAALSSVLGAPEAAPYFGAAITTPEMTARAFSGSLKASYYQLIDQGVPPGEAIKTAKNQATVDAAKAGLQGALMTIAGAKLGLRPAEGYKFTPQFKSIVTGIAKETGKFGKEAMTAGLPNAGIIGGLEAASNVIAQKQGINRDISHNVFEAAGGQLALELALGGVLKLGGKAAKVILNNAARQPQGAIQTTLKDMESHGTITPIEGQTISDKIDAAKLIDSQIPPHVEDENSRLKIADLIQHKEKLEGDLETLNKAYHPAIKQKISDIDEEIQKLSGLSVKEKTEGTTPTPKKTEGDKRLTEMPEEIKSPNLQYDESETKAEVLGNEGANPAPSLISVIYPHERRFHDTFITGEIERNNYSPPVSENGKSAIEEAYRRRKEVEDAGFDFLPHEQPHQHTPTTVAIGNVYIEKQNKGLGTLGYILKGEEYLKRGRNIVSEPEDREDAATGVWKKLVKLGLAEETSPGHYKYGGERESSFTNKNKTNAIQEPSASSVLQHPQEGVGIQGGERERVERGQQGEIPSEEGEAKAPGEEENVGGKEPPPFKMWDLPFEPSTEELSGITHEATEETRQKFGLGGEPYESARKYDYELNEDANKAIKGGYDVNKLIDKLNGGHNPTDLENTILKKYKSYLDSKVQANPSDENLSEIRRFSKATDVAGTLAGRGLRSRKGMEFDDKSLGGYFEREMDIAGTSNLAPDHKAQIIKEHTEITEKEKAYEDKISQLEADLAKEKARKEVKKSSVGTTKKSHTDYTNDRSKIIDSIKEKLRKARGEASIVIVPYAKELITIAPDVAKLVKSYVDEFKGNLEDVVKGVHAQMKEIMPQITEKDIHNIIAGEYSETRTRNDLAARLRDLRTQAQLVNKLEDLEKGVANKTQKERLAKNREIEQLREKIKEFQRREREANRFYKDEVGKTPLEKYKDKVKKEIAELESKIKSGDFSKAPKREPLKLDKEAINLQDQLIKLKQEREQRLAQMQYDKSSFANKAYKNTMEAIGIPRTIMASMDLSAPLRQAAVATVAHPGYAGKAAVEMIKSAVSQKNFDRWLSNLKESQIYQTMQESGLYIADPNTLHMTDREEAFMSHMAEKIPLGIGKAIAGSERAYTAYLNKMRADLFMRAADAFSVDGKTFENSPELYKAMAGFINASTGRGKLADGIKTAAPVLNNLFFSPRLIASRLQLLNPAYYIKLPKEVRMMALGDMAKFIGVGAAVLGLAKLGGAEVEDDPRSSDFGKIKVGDTRWDIWGGFQQYIRVLSQELSGKAKSSITGNVSSLAPTTHVDDFGDTKTTKPRRTRADVAITFLRGKLAPVPGTIWDALAGRDVVGNEFDPTKKIVDLFTPMVANDIKDAWKEQGIKSLFTVGVPSAFGVGVSTYGGDKKKTADAP